MSVPSSNGDFIRDQRAKFVRPSASPNLLKKLPTCPTKHHLLRTRQDDDEIVSSHLEHVGVVPGAARAADDLGRVVVRQRAVKHGLVGV